MAFPRLPRLLRLPRLPRLLHFPRLPRLAVLVTGVLALTGCLPSPLYYAMSRALPPGNEIQVWAYKWPSPVSGPEVDLGPVIEEFENANPGVRVRVSTMGYHDCIRQVQEALDSGEPPDVFLPPPGALAWYSSSLQVDFRDSISQSGMEAYLPHGIAACSVHDRLLALPTWIEGRAWVCNSAVMPAVGFDIARTIRWTWGEFEDLCAALKERGILPAIIDPTSPDMMADLGYEPPRDTEAPPLAVILSSSPAEMCRSLARQGLAETTFVGFPERRSIESFRHGKTGFMAGISPILASEILTMAKPERGFSPALVPVPSTGVPGSPLRAGGVIVFRQPRGPDSRTTLAITLAAAISRASPSAGLPPVLVPAFRHNLGEWTVKHGWNAVVALQSVHGGSTSPMCGLAEVIARRDSRERMRRDMKRGFRQP